jgi:hypothetical protein
MAGKGKGKLRSAKDPIELSLDAFPDAGVPQDGVPKEFAERVSGQLSGILCEGHSVCEA